MKTYSPTFNTGTRKLYFVVPTSATKTSTGLQPSMAITVSIEVCGLMRETAPGLIVAGVQIAHAGAAVKTAKATIEEIDRIFISVPRHMIGVGETIAAALRLAASLAASLGIAPA